MVTEAEQIEFERFAFHHFHIGDVADNDSGEIGLAGNRTQAGEFGADEFDEIIVIGMLVVEGFEHFGRVIGAVLGFLTAQQRDAAKLLG